MLLMSSLVQAKWMNSARDARLVSFTFSFRKYSTAFTSWFVVRSISFTRRASAREKSAAIACSAARSPDESAGHSAISAASHKASSQAHSTRTRRLISPNSEKTSVNSAHFEA